MNKVAIILDEAGNYQMAYADTEVEVTVLQRGQTPEQDAKIDAIETELEECS